MNDAIAVMIADPMSELPDNSLDKDNIHYILDDTITPTPEAKRNVLIQFRETLETYDPVQALNVFSCIDRPKVKRFDDVYNELRQLVAFKQFYVKDKTYHTLRFIFSTVFTEEQNDKACEYLIKNFTVNELMTGLNSTSSNDSDDAFFNVVLERYKNNERFSRKVKLVNLDMYQLLESRTSC